MVRQTLRAKEEIQGQMNNKEYLNSKEKAEKILNKCLLNASIVGMRFALPTLQIEIDDKEYYLNIESKYIIYDHVPNNWPYSEDEIEIVEDQEKAKLIKLDGVKIKKIELMETHPSLIIYFENAKVLFINGIHDLYESWQLGEMFDKGNGITLVACPGGNISFWEKNA